MRLALAASGALLLALLTWLLLSGIDTNASAYADTQRAFDDFALAEASIGRDVLQARAGLLGNYDVLAQAEDALESATGRIRLHVETENLDPKPVEALAAAVGQYEDLIERFKTGNSLLQNSLSYVGQLSTDPAFGALGDQFASSATALAAAVLRLARDPSPESAQSLQQYINRFEAQAPTGGLEGEAAHALLAHARLLSDLMPEVDQTLRALVAAPSRKPFEETRELLARAQAAFEVTAQRFRVLLYAVSLALLVIALRLGQRLWTRTLKIRRLVDANIIGIFVWDFGGRILEANQAFLHIVGYDHEDLVAGHIRWTDLTPPEWRDRDTRLIQEHKVTGTLQPFEKEYFRKDGTRVPVLIGVATFEEGGDQGVAFVLDLTERKRAEEALRRSEANLAEAQRLSHTGSWALSPAATKILYWSEECYRIWGFDPAQGLPDRETVWRRIHPNDRDRVLDEAQGALRRKRDYTIEFRIVLPDGKVKYLEAVGRHLFSEPGELVQVVGTNVDLTERKRAEEALRDSEYKLRQIIETVPSFLWSTDPAGEPTQLNQRMLDYSGMRFEAFLHGGWEAFVHPDDFPETAKSFYHAIQSGTSHQAVNRLRRADGEFRWHHTRAEPLRDEQGHIIQWYGLSVDIDEAKKAEDRLRRSEAYLAEAQRLTHTVIWARSVDRTTLYWSEEGYQLWGLDPQDGPPTRETILQRIHPDDRDRAIERGQEASRQNRDYTHEFRIVLPDGTVKDIQACSRHLFSERGEPVEVLRTYLDVTDRKREHERLRQLESDLAHMNRLSMMGELAASLAHEITQPIASAHNNARAALNFLNKDPAEQGEVREALGAILADADRAGNIIDRIRDHVKKAPPRKHRFDLNEAMSEVLVLARSAITKHGVSVQTRLTEEAAPVEGDRVQLQQVALNLVLNAVEAMGSVEAGPRELMISTGRSQENGVLVAVRDSGPGINPEHIERVFEAFYTTKSSGVGMGLSVCRSIINAHGGRLWAEANEPRGAVLQFTLPGAETYS